MNDINIDLADYEVILSYKGKIDGRVGECNISEFISYLNSELKSSILLAKGILIRFGLNEKSTLLSINDIMAEVNDLTNEDAEIIFSTNFIKDLDEESLKYQILITGL